MRSSARHGIIEATAGSGKTTTLVQVAAQLPVGSRACFLAFNRSTAAELRARLPPHVEATTLHALGRASLAVSYRRAAGAAPSSGKYRALALRALAPLGVQADLRPVAANYLAGLADYCRLALTPPGNAAAVASTARRHGLITPQLADHVGALHPLLGDLLRRGANAAAEGSLDFTDMLYVPVKLELELPKFDFVCVDEAQDLSPLSLALLERLVRRGARALLVGDPAQAIYAFAGAQPGSIAMSKERLDAELLPLSVSYRCPVRHVTLARRFSPSMLPRRGAPPGRVRLTQFARLAGELRAGDLVMSRVNAPLPSLAVALLARGESVTLLGVDLRVPVVELARELFGGSVPPDALHVVAQHAAAEAQALEAEFVTSERLKDELLVSSERHRALTALLRRLKLAGGGTADDLARLAEALLRSQVEEGAGSAAELRAEVRGGVLLCSIHRAKGREAQRVFLLFPEELAPPGPAAAIPGRPESGADPLGLGVTPEDSEAEANVLFVALTRAKRELVLVQRSRGAIRERLAAQARASAAGPHGLLARRWSEVLSLATLMHRRGGRG